MKKDKVTVERDKAIERMLFPYEGNYGITNWSYLGVRPGELVIFEYIKLSDEGGQSMVGTRLGIVVASQRTSSGLFISTRSNNLMNVFLLDQLSEDLFSLVVNNLYNKEYRCTYKRAPKVLAAFMGKKNFRTLNVRYLKSFRKININIDKFKVTGK